MLNGHAFPPVNRYPATIMNNLNAAHPTTISKLYKRELPDSQESFVSTASSIYAAPLLLPSSSNVSTSTVADTDITSPSSSNPPSSQSQSQPVERAIAPSPTRSRGQNAQPTAPRIDTSNAPRTGDTAASPMSLDSPVTQGFKRTADGTVKSAGLTVDSSIAPAAGHNRTKSTESTSNSRIGELSAQLKTRLSYAMVKVQNGWEKQSLEELEELPSQRTSPISAGRSEGSRPTFDSPQTIDRRRRPSGVSESSDQMMLSPGQSTPSDMSRSLATTPSFWRSGFKAQPSPSVNGISATATKTGPVLAPAAEIGPRRKRRSSASCAPPPLLSSTQRKHYSDLSGSPRTPTTAPRAGILRMPSQQAEKDAVDTLLFMSSPNNSSRLAHTSMDAQTHPSPLRAEVSGVRRVMFENNPSKDTLVNSQKQGQGTSGQYAAHYRADPARR